MAAEFEPDKADGTWGAYLADHCEILGCRSGTGQTLADYTRISEQTRHKELPGCMCAYSPTDMLLL
jgi:hypothetical protein